MLCNDNLNSLSIVTSENIAVIVKMAFAFDLVKNVKKLSQK